MISVGDIFNVSELTMMLENIGQCDVALWRLIPIKVQSRHYWRSRHTFSLVSNSGQFSYPLPNMILPMDTTINCRKFSYPLPNTIHPLDTITAKLRTVFVSASEHGSPSVCKWRVVCGPELERQGSLNHCNHLGQNFRGFRASRWTN